MRLFISITTVKQIHIISIILWIHIYYECLIKMWINAEKKKNNNTNRIVIPISAANFLPPKQSPGKTIKVMVHISLLEQALHTHNSMFSLIEIFSTRNLPSQSTVVTVLDPDQRVHSSPVLHEEIIALSVLRYNLHNLN